MLPETPKTKNPTRTRKPRQIFSPVLAKKKKKSAASKAIVIESWEEDDGGGGGGVLAAPNCRGPQGEDGKDGINGKNGRDGKDGKPCPCPGKHSSGGDASEEQLAFAQRAVNVFLEQSKIASDLFKNTVPPPATPGFSLADLVALLQPRIPAQPAALPENSYTMSQLKDMKELFK